MDGDDTTMDRRRDESSWSLDILCFAQQAERTGASPGASLVLDRISRDLVSRQAGTGRDWIGRMGLVDTWRLKVEGRQWSVVSGQ